MLRNADMNFNPKVGTGSTYVLLTFGLNCVPVVVLHVNIQQNSDFIILVCQFSYLRIFLLTVQRRKKSAPTHRAVLLRQQH